MKGRVNVNYAVRRTYYQWSRPQFKLIIANGVDGLVKEVNQIKIHEKKDGNISNITVEDSRSSLSKIMDSFTPVDFAFGYGSGVLKQDGYSESDVPQIDVIMGVNDPTNWHDANLKLNPSHYSALGYMGPRTILHVQALGAGVYFNPYVPIEHKMVKYGIVSLKDALKDLVEWNNLYIAGRLQKPVKFLVDHPLIDHAVDYNRQLALHLALLLRASSTKDSSISFTRAELYETITSISYLGDFRIVLGGENPNKIKNIVAKQMSNFNELYGPYIESLLEENILQITKSTSSTSLLRLSLSNNQLEEAMESLPLAFRNKLYHNTTSNFITDRILLRQNLLKSITATVGYPSIIQTAKGVFTAGAVKSVKYAWEKKRKSFR